MKALFTILLICLGLTAAAQSDSLLVKLAMRTLDNALLTKNKSMLQKLLHKDVSFGHSSGWIENKAEVIKDVETGFLVYSKIENKQSSVQMGEGFATARTTTVAEGTRDGKAFQLTLHVLQVWMKYGNEWQLVARQSAKL